MGGHVEKRKNCIKYILKTFTYNQTSLTLPGKVQCRGGVATTYAAPAGVAVGGTSQGELLDADLNSWLQCLDPLIF